MRTGLQKVVNENNNYRIIIKGLNRVQVLEYFQNNNGTLKSEVKRLYVNNKDEILETALVRKLK